MHFQKALVTVMDYQGVSIQELATRTGSDLRWILSITSNSDWRPKLDTILRLCYALRINVFSFIGIAEAGLKYNEINSKETFSTYCSIVEHMRQILDLQPKHISMALRSYRLECGFSQRNLEKLTPFNVHTICTREGKRYQNYPTVTTLYSYCDAYKISLQDFVIRAFSYIDK
jgi:transcriptional regulator with XRE-family HTH domain